MEENQKSMKEELGNIDSKLNDHIIYDEMSNVKQIDIYEKYCEANPTFPNNKAVMAIKNIKDNYQNCLKNKQFK